MGLTFTWDPDKAASNLAKHHVSFEEASTIFGNPLSIAILDPDRSDQEERSVLIEESHRGRLLVVSHTESGDNIRIISARAATKANVRTMSKPHRSNEMRSEYDFSQGVHGKYAARYAQGTNVVVLDPDVAKEFKTSAEVNEALRQVADKRHASG